MYDKGLFHDIETNELVYALYTTCRVISWGTAAHTLNPEHLLVVRSERVVFLYIQTTSFYTYNSIINI